MSNVVNFRPRASAGGIAARTEQLAGGPCTHCPNTARCAAGLACLPFSTFYLSRGKTLWREAPREPSRDIYKRLFPTSEAAF
jgi:hypothetical protein